MHQTLTSKMKNSSDIMLVWNSWGPSVPSLGLGGASPYEKQIQRPAPSTVLGRGIQVALVGFYRGVSPVCNQPGRAGWNIHATLGNLAADGLLT